MNITFSPAPKVSRIADPEEIRYVMQKRDGTCMIGSDRPGKYGPCLFPVFHCHHIENQGAGGNDARTNLIKLCPRHHDMAQAKVIPREELREILAQRYGYRY